MIIRIELSVLKLPARLMVLVSNYFNPFKLFEQALKREMISGLLLPALSGLKHQRTDTLAGQCHLGPVSGKAHDGAVIRSAGKREAARSGQAGWTLHERFAGCTTRIEETNR
jgi:hypothetical protein